VKNIAWHIGIPVLKDQGSRGGQGRAGAGQRTGGGAREIGVKSIQQHGRGLVASNQQNDLVREY
jgi:hypothetical protein